MKRENLIVGAVTGFFGVVLAAAIYFFTGVTGDHGLMISLLSSTAERLEALETNKARATAKRFTADDAQALMACLRIPNLTPEREACLRSVETQITERSVK